MQQLGEVFREADGLMARRPVCGRVGGSDASREVLCPVRCDNKHDDNVWPTTHPPEQTLQLVVERLAQIERLLEQSSIISAIVTMFV